MPIGGRTYALSFAESNPAPHVEHLCSLSLERISLFDRRLLASVDDILVLLCRDMGNADSGGIGVMSGSACRC